MSVKLRSIVGITALAVIGTAQAQVYKCKEDGRTVFKDVPCPIGAERVPTYTAPPSADDAAAAAARAERDRQALAGPLVEEAPSGDGRIGMSDADKAAQDAKCAALRKGKNEAKYWAGEFRYEANIQRERAKADYYEDRQWWECKTTR
jgi:hypothetical protein